MKHFSEMVEEALDDETTIDTAPSGEANPAREVVVPGGAPGPLSPEEMNDNPNSKVEREIIEKMSASSRLALDKEQAKAIWDGVTSGAVHKITACMEKMKGKVDDPAAFCNSLAQDVGYDPNA